MELTITDTIHDLQSQITEATATLADLDLESRTLRTTLRQKDQIIDKIMAAQAAHPANELDIEHNRLRSAVRMHRDALAALDSELATLESQARVHELEIVRLVSADERDGRTQLAEEARAISEQLRSTRAVREALNGLSHARTEALAQFSDRIKATTEIVRIHTAPRQCEAAAHAVAVGTRAVCTSPERQETLARLIGARELFTRNLPTFEGETVASAEYDKLLAEATRLRTLLSAADDALDGRTADVESLQGLLCKAEVALARVARREVVLNDTFETAEVSHAAAVAEIESAHAEEAETLRAQLTLINQQLVNAYE